MAIKDRLKQYAYELGADLVGFGSIDRCAHAPLMMSPQGVFPGAQSIIVLGIHHPDACIERGGEAHPQEIGPYSVQYLMNSRLDEMAYRLATFVEQCGYGAIPVASSNIWRYTGYKDLTAVFAPDVSHIYMAVVAGLADLGYNGLAITPEYGARNRFITVITDAVIEPDPLIPPGTVCDGCMLCRKHCPTSALSKEIDGEKVLHIGEYAYRFPNKNLWRCAWGEHFDLDLDLDIPEVVTEQVILDTVKAHGIRSGEMGQCLKFCVPKPIRSFDRGYSRTPMREHWATTNTDTMSRAVVDRVLTRPLSQGADVVLVRSAAELRAAGLDLETVLPGAQSAITLAVTCPPGTETGEFTFGAQYQMDSLCYDLTRRIEELGFRALMTIERSGSHPDAVADVRVTEVMRGMMPGRAGRTIIANTVITRLPIPSQLRGARQGVSGLDHSDATADLTGHLSALARELGADVVGCAPASRLDEIAWQLRSVFTDDTILDARDRSIRFTPWEPEITVRSRTVRIPEDHLAGAQSVLVFGLRFHEAVLRWATRPPAEAVGPYAYLTYVTNWLGSVIGYQLIKRLEELGYRGAMTMDLTGTESVTANPRGPQPDLFANRFAGLAAGLGYLTTSGHLATPQFGLRQRLIAIVTDAPLTPSPLATEEPLCATCSAPCVTACPSQAITDGRITLRCEEQISTFHRVDARRCDWVKRYALMGESGFQYLGSPLDIAPDATITPVALDAALRQHDPIKRYRPVVVEPCVIQCPLAVRDQDGAMSTISGNPKERLTAARSHPAGPDYA